MTPETLLSYQLPLFDGLRPDDLAGIPLEVCEQSLSAWQTLFHQHDSCKDLYFLLSGSLMAVAWTAEGREIVFSQFEVGAYFGEITAIDGKARSLAVVAKTDALVLAMQRHSFLALFDRIPVIRNRVTHNMAGRIRSLTERAIELAVLSVEQRVGAHLLRLAAGQGAMTQGTVIDPAPTHAEIGGHIGANREMVSRSIGRLTRQGLIKTSRRRIEIVDPAALADLLA